MPLEKRGEGGYHRTHPLSPLEETDPSSGPSYSLERASYEIYKQASALQIIHHWTVRRACVCARANVYIISRYICTRVRTYVEESRAPRFGPLASLVVRGPLTYTLWPMCIPLGRGNTSSCLALEHPTSISSKSAVRRLYARQRPDLAARPGDTSRGWMQCWSSARVFFVLYSTVFNYIYIGDIMVIGNRFLIISNERESRVSSIRSFFVSWDSKDLYSGKFCADSFYVTEISRRKENFEVGRRGMND